jgi:hypothetical protein
MYSYEKFVVLKKIIGKNYQLLYFTKSDFKKSYAYFIKPKK